MRFFIPLPFPSIYLFSINGLNVDLINQKQNINLHLLSFCFVKWLSYFIKRWLFAILLSLWLPDDDDSSSFLEISTDLPTSKALFSFLSLSPGFSLILTSYCYYPNLLKLLFWSCYFSSQQKQTKLATNKHIQTIPLNLAKYRASYQSVPWFCSRCAYYSEVMLILFNF